jgi:poly(3-hydroxybutyrate) depolymerase
MHLAVFLIAIPTSAAPPPAHWWDDKVEAALVQAEENRPELEKALTAVPRGWRQGMAFLIANMPTSDLHSLKAQFLLTNVEQGYKARAAVPWGENIPEEIFLNHVLPYANVGEKRDEWRKEFYDLCLPLVKDCKTPSEAAQKLNREVFKKLKVGYSTQRKAPNQSPKESIAQGKASCTGLSILLSDACRSVCVPARLVGTPLWTDKRGNHTWVEIWDKDWHFTGACEADPRGLDRGWFVHDAAQAKKDSVEHAIYAASFQKTKLSFPLVWARQNKDVSAENVTDRYAKKPASEPDAVRLSVRVVDAARKRVVMSVTVTAVDDPTVRHRGESRGETADANDLLTFDLGPNREYVVAVGGVEKTIRTGAAGRQQTVEITLPAAAPDAGGSSAALKALRDALAAQPGSLSELARKDFAAVPLTKADASAARELIWKAHAAIIRKERSGEIKDRLLKDARLEMPFFFKVFGERPEGGHSLWISLHGGGGAPRRVNDQQWENQKKLYTLAEGIYLAPRAPTDTWNLWHQDHIDRLFGRLIEDMIVLEDVNPDRVYVLGYSAGGDGVYQLAPRMADRWAGAAMMAGHPNGVSMLSLRNVPFALQVGGKDSAYNRNKVAREYGEQLAKLRKDDPKGYEHFVKIHEDKGHWMERADRAALPWLAKFTRNPLPDRVVWKQTGVARERSYWLAVPPGEAKSDALVVASRVGQTITVSASEKVSKLLVHLDDRMMDLDREVKITHAGKELFAGRAPRTMGVMLRTLAGCGDPRLMFDAEVAVELPAEKRALSPRGATRTPSSWTSASIDFEDAEIGSLKKE